MLLDVYIQSIGLGQVVFSELFFSSLVPIKPGDDKAKRVTLSKGEKETFSVSPELKAILIGLILGDANVQKDKRAINGNARLRFVQGTVHKEYLLKVYELFKDYCPAGPKLENLKPDIRTGKVYSSIHFNTYSLPCFNELYILFYLDGRKIVPLNIAELLTPLGLAYWIFDDGGFDKSSQRVTLNTQSFTLAEVNLLAKTLNDKWDLKCTIYKNKNGFVIVITRKSLPILKDLLKDITPPMMLHKIGL
jgi:hypothetical protein